MRYKKTYKNRLLAFTSSLLLTFLTVASIPVLAQEKKLEDREIADAIENEYRFDHAINNNNVTIAVNDGIAELTGDVQNLMAKNRATRIAQTVKGVRSVSNRIDVVPPANLTDLEIENLIELALLEDPATESFEVKPFVKNNEVTLTGDVDSWQEKQLSEKVAASVKGVTKVVNNLDVTVSSDRLDSEIKYEVEQKLRWNTQVDDGLIDVSVNEGKVMLDGIVGSDAEKTNAKWNCWVAGVKDVDVSSLDVKWYAADNDLRKDKYASKTDDEIEKAIKDAAVYDPRVFSFNITPESKAGWVTLRGTVDNLKAKKASEMLAKHTVGVVGVTNRIKVKSEEKLSNELIEAKIENALINNAITEAYEIDVLVYNNIATLTGTVDSYLEKTEAEWVASGVRGVSEVNNNIEVNFDYAVYWWEPYDYYSFYYTPNRDITYSTTSSVDKDIKRSIKNELWWSPYVSASSVNINVNNGVATLSGTVDNLREYQKAAENAWEGGAWMVVNDLDIK